MALLVKIDGRKTTKDDILARYMKSGMLERKVARN